MDNSLTIYRSKKRAYALIVAGLVLAIAGGLVIQFTTENVLAWCLWIVAAMVLILGVGSLTDRKPYIIITSEGITETSVIRQEIGWDAILAVDDFFYRGQDIVRILVSRSYRQGKLEASWFWRLDRIYAREGLKALYIRTQGMEINALQLVGIIKRMAGAPPESRAEALEELKESIRS